MRAHQIITKNVITVLPGTPIVEAPHKMLDNHVRDCCVRLVGIVSESDFVRRSEIDTQRKRPSWLQYFLSPDHSADDFVHERGRKGKASCDLVTANEHAPLDELVRMMEKNGIKRLPVLRDSKWSASSLVRICFRPWLAWLGRFQIRLRTTTTSVIGLSGRWRPPTWRPLGLHEGTRYIKCIMH